MPGCPLQIPEPVPQPVHLVLQCEGNRGAKHAELGQGPVGLTVRGCPQTVDPLRCAGKGLEGSPDQRRLEEQHHGRGGGGGDPRWPIVRPSPVESSEPGQRCGQDAPRELRRRRSRTGGEVGQSSADRPDLPVETGEFRILGQPGPNLLRLGIIEFTRGKS